MATRRNHEFEVAREMVRNECLGSISQYTKWHALHKPSRIPKRPDRAYKDKWISWPDFLGNDNKFPFIKHKFKTYDECIKFVHKLNITSYEKWFEYCKSGNKPKDIPARPDVFYRKTGEWYTWTSFLGYKLNDKLKNIQQMNNLLTILKDLNKPNNVYTIIKHTGDKNTVLDILNKLHKKHIITFILHSDITNILNINVIKWKEGDINEYVVTNIYSLISDLQQDNIKM